jgi:hypothetical protein
MDKIVKFAFWTEFVHDVFINQSMYGLLGLIIVGLVTFYMGFWPMNHFLYFNSQLIFVLIVPINEAPYNSIFWAA